MQTRRPRSGFVSLFDLKWGHLAFTIGIKHNRTLTCYT